MHEICRAHEDLVTLVGTEPCLMKGSLRCIHCRTHLLFACRGNLGDLLPRRLVVDGKRALPRDASAVDEHFDGLHFIGLPPKTVHIGCLFIFIIGTLLPKIKKSQAPDFYGYITLSLRPPPFDLLHYHSSIIIKESLIP